MSPACRAAGAVASTVVGTASASAYAAQQLGVAARIYLPRDADATKIATIGALGAELVFTDSVRQARAAALDHVTGTGARFVSAYNRPVGHRGRRHGGLEEAATCQRRRRNSRLGRHRRRRTRRRHRYRLFGSRSRNLGGAARGQPGPRHSAARKAASRGVRRGQHRRWPRCRGQDRHHHVPFVPATRPHHQRGHRGRNRAAMRWLAEEHHLYVEPSAAAPVAALIRRPDLAHGKRRIVVVLTGRNIALDRWLALVNVPSVQSLLAGVISEPAPAGGDPRRRRNRRPAGHHDAGGRAAPRGRGGHDNDRRSRPRRWRIFPRSTRFGDLTASPLVATSLDDCHVDALFVAVSLHSLPAALDGAAARWLRELPGCRCSTASTMSIGLQHWAPDAVTVPATIRARASRNAPGSLCTTARSRQSLYPITKDRVGSRHSRGSTHLGRLRREPSPGRSRGAVAQDGVPGAAGPGDHRGARRIRARRVPERPGLLEALVVDVLHHRQRERPRGSRPEQRSVRPWPCSRRRRSRRCSATSKPDATTRLGRDRWSAHPAGPPGGHRGSRVDGGHGRDRAAH